MSVGHKTKLCPHCHNNLFLNCFTSTQAKYCNNCKKLIKLEQQQARQQKAYEKLKNKKSKEVTRQTIAQLKKTVQRKVNAYVRLRDQFEMCISCGKRVIKEAGHFYAQGSTGVLRYNLNNINGQCYQCNHFLHGNLLEYRINLVKKIGPEEVEYLELMRHVTKKWTREELEAILVDIEQKTK